MKNLVRKLPERIVSARGTGLDALDVMVFSFSGADPVSFGVCDCNRN